MIRSGTEEEYNHFMQLLEDISTYQRDVQDQKRKKKENKKKKEKEDKQKAMEMRAAALNGIASRHFLFCIFSV